jgi:hypothetical protein
VSMLALSLGLIDLLLAAASAVYVVSVARSVHGLRSLLIAEQARYAWLAAALEMVYAVSAKPGDGAAVSRLVAGVALGIEEDESVKTQIDERAAFIHSIGRHYEWRSHSKDGQDNANTR